MVEIMPTFVTYLNITYILIIFYVKQTKKMKNLYIYKSFLNMRISNRLVKFHIKDIV